jgi:hypothetical protein
MMKIGRFEILFWKQWWGLFETRKGVNRDHPNGSLAFFLIGPWEFRWYLTKPGVMA